MRRVVWVGLLCLFCAGCAPGANGLAHTEPNAGFWLGLWHGVIAPVTFLIGRFSEGVGVYEVHNNGGWYDFGFVIGVGMLHGGGGAAGMRRRRQRQAR